MGNILGKEKPLKEVLRENKRMITRAIRELDREKMQLEKEEKRLTIEIKKAAKEQQMSSVKIMAKVRFCFSMLLTKKESCERQQQKYDNRHCRGYCSFLVRIVFLCVCLGDLSSHLPSSFYSTTCICMLH
jgi:hypothetical protein